MFNSYSVEKAVTCIITERAWSRWARMREKTLDVMRQNLVRAGCHEDSVRIAEPEYREGHYQGLGKWVGPHWVVYGYGFAKS